LFCVFRRPRREAGPVARAGGGRPGPGGWSPGTVACPDGADRTVLAGELRAAGEALPSLLAPTALLRRAGVARQSRQRRGPPRARRLAQSG